MRKRMICSDGGNAGKGVALILVTLLLLVIVPLMGLAVDGGIMYLLKARLAQAVDASCLAGARSLSRGMDLASQRASAQDTATRYFQANYKDNYWGSTVSFPTPLVWEDNATKMRFVQVSATATAPLYFLRLLGKQTATVAASAQARRRDVNIILAMDRSGSLGRATPPALPTSSGHNTGQWPLLNAATWFVNQFAPGRDNVGLATFGGSYFLANPTLNFQPTIVDDIAHIYSYGGTSMTTAFWESYKALASLPDQNGNPNGQVGALNVILLFTDGRPNGLTADFPLSARVNAAACAPAIPILRGWFTVSASNPTSNSGCYNYRSPFGGGGSCVAGLFNPNAIATVYDPNDATDSERITAPGCQFARNISSSDASNMYLDFNTIPAQDVYQNQTNPATNRYQSVGQARINYPTELNAAAANATDYAAQRMRNGFLNGIIPRIYTVGLDTTSAGSNVPPPDHALMIRLSNTQQVTVGNTTYTNPIYDATKPSGMYVFATDQADLQDAFQRIASEILRLSQ